MRTEICTITSTYSGKSMGEALRAARAHGHVGRPIESRFLGGVWQLTFAGAGRHPYRVLLERRKAWLITLLITLRAFVYRDVCRAAGKEARP
ncbi:MAG TPA: hypothetical protein VIZ86_16520 [Pseudomonas sp.]